ncbi:MAG: acyl-CoA dehydrogenase family protein [Dehalococcoidia bacterium]|nr:acyl-CoA dehydrogenase family protein [Dehalococcoidia bacterium]MDD5493634.1 acyl-CoA dehydrogenase family protein [Dehalococcoidia bacterium]
MDFNLTDAQKAHRDEVFKVCAELNKKKPKTWVGFESQFDDEVGWEFHKLCAKEFAKRGWLALGWPKEYGGKGDMMDKVLFQEGRGYYDLPGSDIFGVAMLAPTLLAAGSEELKKEFLPKIANAELMFCELWSEPNAGSDLAGLTATAIRKGDEFIVNGQKTWNTGAHFADWAFGVYKSDPNGKKHHNLTFLLCDMKSPGVTVKSIPYMSGTHVYNEVYLDDVKMSAKYIVGQENEGWAVVNVLAGFERSNLDMVYGLVRGIEELVEFCNETKKNGKPLSQDPIVRNRIADLSCSLEAVRCLAYRVADQQNRNEMGLMDAAAVKIFASELMEKYSHLASDILGPYGQVKNSPWAKMGGTVEYTYQGCFVPIVSMGTNEIQRNIIAWYGLGLPRMK